MIMSKTQFINQDSTGTEDIRQDHINAIRNRLKIKREEYCKTLSNKKVLGPGAIHDYLEREYHVCTSKTTI